MDKKLITDLPKEDQDKWMLDYYQSTVIVRGNVLNAVTTLEMAIDVYITNYFTNDIDKGEELMNLIIAPRMTFENKVQVLMVLLERHNKTVLDKNPSLSNDILDIIAERNVLAHYPLDTTPSGLNNYYTTQNLTFFKFKNVRAGEGGGKKKEIKLTNSIIYNVDKTKDLLLLIDKYQLIIALTIPTAPPSTI